MLSSRDAKLS
jgi:hypothetical protein